MNSSGSNSTCPVGMKNDLEKEKITRYHFLSGWWLVFLFAWVSWVFVDDEVSSIVFDEFV